MPQRSRQWAAWAAVLGGLILVVATLVDWLAGVGSINDPLNPRWREAVVLLVPGFVIAAFGLAGIQARFTGHSMVGLGGATGMVIGIIGFAAGWTVLHGYVFPIAPISMSMVFVGVVVLGVAMLRAATAPWPAIALLSCSPIGIFIALGPPRPGALILLLATFGMASIWLGYATLQAEHQPGSKKSRASRSSSKIQDARVFVDKAQGVLSSPAEKLVVLLPIVLPALSPQRATRTREASPQSNPERRGGTTL